MERIRKGHFPPALHKREKGKSEHRDRVLG